MEDLLDLPDDAPRVELVDGVIQVTPSPSLGHQDISSLLWLWLRTHAPAHLRAAQAVGVALNANTSRQPDVLLRRAEVTPDRSLLVPDDVILAVEVVSPGTRGAPTGSPSRVSTPPRASRSTGASNRIPCTSTPTAGASGSGRAESGSMN
ncbi:Uma2 family endonuclease [Micromonospora sp. NPDC023814]|uniref:Uma2 family endonuclease n=1 Tax=Micromonospora sp. NPDC023814 TaxID=3154596 RepID=UPI0034106197